MLSRAWLERHPRAVATSSLVGLWLFGSTTLAVVFSGQVRDWSVMTDELLYAKLATSIAETLSPLPSVHGQAIGVYNQLYPALLAPLYGALSPPDAFRAAHVLNAFVMASAVFPAYLLTRQILGRGWSFAVAALSILVPWMILTGFVMTEVAAYPAFLWAVLGLQLAIADPSPRRDLLAAGALVLGALARTQFLALAVVLPLAVVAHEVGYARDVRRGARAALERHRPLAALYVLVAVATAIVVVLDSPGGLLGVYAVTVEEGSLLPAGAWSVAARHLDAVAIGCGLAPVFLGGGWLLATAVRPASKRGHALATLSLATVTVLTLEVASFAVRFGSDEVRDRYLFYVVPLLLVATAAALAGVGRARDIALGVSVVTAFFAATAAGLPFTTYPGVWVDSPASVLNELLVEQSGGLGTGTFVALLGVLSGLVLVLGLLLAPRPIFAPAVVATLGVFSVLTLGSEIDRVLSSTGLSGRPLGEPPGVVLDWVDTVVPESEDVAVRAYPVSTSWETTAIRWWDVEFWNRRVSHGYVAPDGHFTYTTFPVEELAPDWETGFVPDSEDAPAYQLATARDARFRLVGSLVGANVGLVVRSVERPYRALWATRGLETDGWTRPGRPATIRVYGAGRVGVSVTFRAPDSAPAGYVLEGENVRRDNELQPAASHAEILDLCVPASGFADLRVRGTTTARIPVAQLGPNVEGTRAVGILVGPIAVRRTGDAC